MSVLNRGTASTEEAGRCGERPNPWAAGSAVGEDND